jgi:hypothetical protein
MLAFSTQDRASIRFRVARLSKLSMVGALARSTASKISLSGVRR